MLIRRFAVVTGQVEGRAYKVEEHTMWFGSRGKGHVKPLCQTLYLTFPSDLQALSDDVFFKEAARMLAILSSQLSSVLRDKLPC